MCLGSDERQLHMASVNAIPGNFRTIERSNVYEDVIDVYREGDIVGEYPIYIEFKGEMAVDEGGVQREMFSAFWEKAYSTLFEGASLLTPMNHPQMDMSIFPIIGRILSHGYLVAGVLPIRIALPTLTCMLLGPTAVITRDVLLDTFLDFISATERAVFKRALLFEAEKVYPTDMQEELMGTLAGFGCRVLPKPSTLTTVIEQVARYEFMSKPAASIALVFSGIPLTHKGYWSSKCPADLQAIYRRLSLSSRKVNSLLSFPDTFTQQEARVAGYLRTMIGNMQHGELRHLMRFITGSCVCITPEIKITFNSLSGLARRPIAHTCDSSLELPSSYANYDDFFREFNAILMQTDHDFSWRMDAV